MRVIPPERITNVNRKLVVRKMKKIRIQEETIETCFKSIWSDISIRRGEKIGTIAVRMIDEVKTKFHSAETLKTRKVILFLIYMERTSLVRITFLPPG